MPGTQSFGPLGSGGADLQKISMTVDEFETIRQIDLDGLTQEECAGQMGVSRTTAQAIYNSARSKLAECLVSGRELYIAGGSYVLCDGEQIGRGCGHCRRRRCREENSGDENNE